MTEKKKKSDEDRNIKETKALLNRIRRRHIGYWKRKFRAKAFQLEVSKFIDHYLNWLLVQKLEDFFDGSKILKISQLYLDSNILENSYEKVMKPYLMNEFKRVRTSGDKMRTYIHPRAIEAITHLLENPDLLPKSWLEESLRHDAFHKLMASLLYNALKEFTLQVNPFFSNWGLPALLKKGPFGMGTKVVDTIRTEFEKQLEPQIKNFLKFFTGPSLQHVFSYITSSTNEAIFIQMRKDLFQNFLEEDTSDFALALDDEMLEQLCELIGALTMNYLKLPSTKTQLEKSIESFLSEKGEMTFSQLFEKYDIDTYSWSRELLDLLWPALQKYFKSKDFEVIIELMVNEFYDIELANLSK